MVNLFQIIFLLNLFYFFIEFLIAKKKVFVRVFLFILYFFPILSFSKSTILHAPTKAAVTIDQNILEEEIILNRYSNNDQVLDFIDEMVVKHNFEHSKLRNLFDKVSYSSTAIELFSTKSPTMVKNWVLHKKRIINEKLINNAFTFYKNNHHSVETASLNFSIPRSIILAILGIETNFGRNMGNFHVLDVLTTLAFDYPDTSNQVDRKVFFRRNLKDFLIFCRIAQIDPKSVLGSYAGAIGMPQFMPTSILKYAISANGKFFPDLINNPSDAVYSIANFLKKSGWRNGEPIAWVVNKDIGNQELAEAGLKVCRPRQCSLEKFINAGLVFDNELIGGDRGEEIIEKMLAAKVIVIDLPTPMQQPDYMIGFTNFNVLLRYNQNYFYAASVLELAKEIEKKIN